MHAAPHNMDRCGGDFGSLLATASVNGAQVSNGIPRLAADAPVKGHGYYIPIVNVGVGVLRGTKVQHEVQFNVTLQIGVDRRRLVEPLHMRGLAPKLRRRRLAAALGASRDLGVEALAKYVMERVFVAPDAATP